MELGHAARERQSETLRALLLAPAPRPAIYVGKLLGIIALLVAAEIILVPLVASLMLIEMSSTPQDQRSGNGCSFVSFHLTAGTKPSGIAKADRDPSSVSESSN